MATHGERAWVRREGALAPSVQDRAARRVQHCEELGSNTRVWSLGDHC